MATILRAIGMVWILLSVSNVVAFLRKFFDNGSPVHFEWPQALSLALLAGGIGLLLLKEWGRLILIIGCGLSLLVLVGPSLLSFHLGPTEIRHIVFYGIFLGILLIPQAKGVTQN